MDVFAELGISIEHQVIIILVAQLIVGVAVAFAAFRCWSFMLGLAGLLIGGLGGAQAGALLSADLGAAAATLICGIAGSLIGALVLVRLRPLGTFILGGGFILVCITPLLHAAGLLAITSSDALVLLLIIIAAVGGALVAITDRSGIILITAAAGACTSVSSGAALLMLQRAPGLELNNLTRPLTTNELALIPLIAAAAAIFQFATSRSHHRNLDPADSAPPDGLPRPVPASPDVKPVPVRRSA